SNKEAKKALYNAAVFAELLEKNNESLDLYATYMKVGSPSKEERKAILLSQAKLYRKSRSWDKMGATYRSLMREYPAEKLDCPAETARQYDRAGRMTDKHAALQEIERLAQGKTKLGLAAPFAAEAKLKAIS